MNMFDKQFLIQRLKELSFSEKEYWVVAGSAMVLHGFRSQTRDIDLGCSTLLADRLEQQGYFVSRCDDGTRRILFSEDIEIFENWLEGTVEIISGVPVVCVDGLIQMKKKLGREKDLADIALIERKKMQRAGKAENFMDTIRLVIPTEEYLDQVWDYRQECLDMDSHMDGCGPLRQAKSPAEWLTNVISYMDPVTIPEGRVQATQFLAVRESDNKVVAMIQVRHYFNEYLEKYAGNIGYSTRPSERRKGYATEMLRLTLPFCKEICLDKVLIACEPNNPASRRTILANGGVYECTVHEPGADIDLERYWVDL